MVVADLGGSVPKSRWRNRAIAGVLTLALLWPVSATAAPGESSDVATIEAELARLVAVVSEAETSAATAAEAELQAEEQLLNAQAEADAALKRADESAAVLEEARKELAVLAREAYQGVSSSVGSLTPFFTEDPESAMVTSTYLGVISDRTGAEVRSFEALAAVDEILRAEATTALQAEEQALADLATASDLAAQQVTQSSADLEEAQLRREELIRGLAEQRNTTVAEETARQDAREQAARDNANTVALNDALRNAAPVVAAPAPTPAPAPTSPTSPSSPTSPTSPAPAAPGVVVSPASGSYYVTTTVNVRSGPATTYPQIGQLAANSSVTVSGTANGWYLIGTDRWVIGTYLQAGSAPALTPAPAPTPTPTNPTAPATPTVPTAPTPTSPAPAANPAIETAIAYAMAQLGKEYVYGALGPDAYDCSGLTRVSFQQIGITLGRSSRSQYSAGTLVPLGEAQRGDLLFWSSDGTEAGIYHVAIYLGGGMKVHARAPGWGVQHDGVYYTNIMPMVVRL